MPRPWELLLDQVVRERYPRLVAHAALVAGSTSEAPDLVQEALVATFKGRARFTTVEQAEAYVRRAIASRAIDDARRRRRERLVAQRAAAQPAASAEDQAQAIGRDVMRALSVLSPRERACVVLRQMEDLSVAETASVLNLSEGSVKRYTSDGLARLAQILGTHPHVDETVPVRATTTRHATEGAR
ncbi:sigma-70 family RNA polymerase sigma factor [Cellulomonas gilvus]|uniref:RNA polymerase, sigma-24 subunit, ECF subfamily n=1 Tax=Cellulomonas gilvus (strain ATCC 13127 / NRRL B-14078) TaxID=593907 RepID=F8A4S9_CELGA|nr:sigma-70 family RNA polymerase sigma factor [Cellulomonas gilvus]AEI10895.1 RNA polymerase, sigma-24 subunit, ECF subfamily [Cellulomonas gilvus ATCC 13127]